MQIIIPDPIFQTTLFALLFIGALLLSARKANAGSFFDIALTNELKGVAILGVMFSHIGYFLSADTRFLYPFSIIAGVAVNLFLFLSGYGLTISSLRSNLSIVQFYTKRLKKLFLPLWLAITIFFLLDYLILHRSYPISTMVQSYLGFYPRADLWQSLDSPLWYFSLILFYYLLFPLVFWKRFPFLSPLVILLVSQILLQFPLPVQADVYKLYKLHFAAFPLGVALAVFYCRKDDYLKYIPLAIKSLAKTVKPAAPFVRILLLIPLIYLFAYTAIYSGVGGDPKIEQSISLLTMFCLTAIFWLKQIRFKLLEVIGVFSYEIYLIHWPILSRFDFLYRNLPGFLATALYLAVFLALGWILQLTLDFIFERRQKGAVTL